MALAPDLATLFHPTPFVEPAVQRLLTAPPRILHAAISRETADLPAEHCAIQFTQGAWANRWHVHDGEFYHSTWHYTLRLALWTHRLGADPGRHESLRGRIHQALEAAIRRPHWLPYHTLASLNLQTGTESLQVGDDLDCSALTFTGLIAIRSDAWPSILAGIDSAVLGDGDGLAFTDGDGAVLVP